MTDRGVGWIMTEGILLEVGSSEDQITKSIESKDGYDSPKRKVHWVVNEVSCLQGVGKGDPGKITEGKHEAETIMSDVHGSEDGFFKPETVKNVHELKEADEDH